MPGCPGRCVPVHIEENHKNWNDMEEDACYVSFS